MPHKFLPLLLCFTALFFACRKTAPTENPQKGHPCLNQSFSKRLKKTVNTVSHPGTGFSPTVFTTEYFFDTQNRVDSLQYDKTATKIVYAPDGKVDKVIGYYYDSKKVGTITQYFYDNDLIVKTVANYYDKVGNVHPWQAVYFFEYDAEGFLEKMWRENGNDQTVLTPDDCGNILKEQDFYNHNGEEHRLAVHEYTDTFSPYFLIGLDRIFPGGYSVHNPSFYRLVNWDCADYDGSPVEIEYEYDADNLPLKMTAGSSVVEFFYE